MNTDAGVKLTKKQIANINSFEKLMEKWDKDLCINAIAGVLTIMLRGDTKQNPIPEMSNSGGFNPENQVIRFLDVLSDGGDW